MNTTYFPHTCLFCQQPTWKVDLKGSASRMFSHHRCSPCATTFIVNISKGFRGYIMLTSTGHLMYFFPFTQRFYIRKSGSDDVLLDLDHVPNIRPSEADHWLEKLLKLKAFA